MNNSGKTITIFLVVVVILLLCLSGIGIFSAKKENELRKSAEASLEQLKIISAKLEGDLKEAKKQVNLLEEKNKEADDKINDLTESLELEQGVKDELKKQNHDLSEALDNENQSKEKIRTDLTQQLNSAQEKEASLESQLTTAQTRVKELEGQSESLTEKIKRMESDFQKQLEEARAAATAAPSPDDEKNNNEPKTQELKQPAAPLEIPAPNHDGSGPAQDPNTRAKNKEIQLEPIVVAGKEIPQGRVLSVDKENEFLIFNLGEKDGISPGILLSVYRGKNYLGDVKVSRVQPEMSAADFIPPFSSQKVRKNDQVVAKK